MKKKPIKERELKYFGTEPKYHPINVALPLGWKRSDAEPSIIEPDPNQIPHMLEAAKSLVRGARQEDVRRWLQIKLQRPISIRLVSAFYHDYILSRTQKAVRKGMTTKYSQQAKVRQRAIENYLKANPGATFAQTDTHTIKIYNPNAEAIQQEATDV
jgi:hypothetical protein